MKFTSRSLDALKPEAKRYERWETNGRGFGIRVSPSGVKSFVFLYRFGGKLRRMTLGAYPQTALATAHKAHATALEKLAQTPPVDPGAEAQAGKLATRAAPTVADLSAIYMERYAKPNKRSWKKDEQILNRDVLPAWRNLKANSITRPQVATLLHSIVLRGSPTQADATLALLKVFFKFARQQGLIENRPCDDLPRSKPKSKDVHLNEEQVKPFWTSLEASDLPERYKLALKLILVTGQRPGECMGAPVAEFELSRDRWTIPGSRVKNGKTHSVPLNKYARAIVDRAIELGEGSPWLFPSTSLRGHLSTGIVSRELADRRAAFGLPDGFTPHSLRHTARTMLSSLAPYDVCERILNHTLPGEGKTYDHYRYDNEKRAALDSLALKLDGLLTGASGTVVQFQKRGA